MFPGKVAVKVPRRLADFLIFMDSFSRQELHDFYILFFLSSVTLSNMFTELNMNPRFVIFCVAKKVLLSGCIKNPKQRNIFIVLMLSVRRSSYVSPNIIKSSI